MGDSKFYIYTALERTKSIQFAMHSRSSYGAKLAYFVNQNQGTTRKITLSIQVSSDSTVNDPARVFSYAPEDSRLDRNQGSI